MFDTFFKFLKTNNWEISENDTHTMLKKTQGLTREKLHIDKDIKKYQEELDEYNSTLELNVTKYKWWMEQYTRLMSQYSSGILGATKQEAPKKEESPKRERRRR